MSTRAHNPNKLILLILAAVVLVVGAAAFYYGFLSQPQASTREVRIYRNGALYATAYLGHNKDITVHGENGEENVIALTEEGVYMKYSTCQNQLCVHQGIVTPENFSTRFYRNEIICLPNRVTVELVLTDAEAAEIPDV